MSDHEQEPTRRMTWAERAETIFRRVREAVRADGTLAIVETVLPDAPTAHSGCLMDLNMLVMTGTDGRRVRRPAATHALAHRRHRPDGLTVERHDRRAGRAELT